MPIWYLLSISEAWSSTNIIKRIMFIFVTEMKAYWRPQDG